MNPIRRARGHRRAALVAIVALAAVATLGAGVAPDPGGHAVAALRVALDPNNLPFSSASGEGFEVELARMVAHDLGRPLQLVWWSQRRGFIRNTLGAGTCDLVMGVPVTLERATPTQPYYRSTYAFVTRRDRHLHLRTLDDPALRTLRIGVPVVGEDYGAVPPVAALATGTPI